jgi:hypothetical protein
MSSLSRSAKQAALVQPPEIPADYSIRIGTGLIELAPDRIIFRGLPRWG